MVFKKRKQKLTFVFVKSMNPDQKKGGDQELQNVLTSVVFLYVPAPV